MTLRPFHQLGRYICEHSPIWLKILGFAGRDFVIDDGLHWSAAVAFYGLLSIFPLVLVAIDIASWFTDPHGASQHANQVLGQVMPHADAVVDIIEKAVASHHRTGPVSILFLLYTGGRAFAVLSSALNIACDMDRVYGIWQKVLVEVGMLLSIGLLFLGALLANLLVPVFGDLMGPPAQGEAALMAAAGWTLPYAFPLGGFFCLYKFVPRHRCNWQSALLGSAAATLLSAGAKPLFVLYISRLASYSQVYGWLTIGIVLMIWAEIVSVITLYGGEVTSHIQMMVYDGLSGHEVSRRHRLRSPGRSPAKNRPGMAAAPPADS